MFPRTTPTVLVALLALALAACGGPSTPAEAPPAPPATAAPVASAEAPPASAAASAPAPSAEPAATPPPSPAPTVSAEDKPRIDFAAGFLAAVAKRDNAAINGFVPAGEFCKAMASARKKPVSMATCQKEVAQQNKVGLDVFTKAVPQGFEAGPAEVMPIAPKDGIYMVLVRPKGFDGKGPDADKEGFTVMLAEVEGKRFVVFPQKKKEPGGKK